jgi:hypothetical protein
MPPCRLRDRPILRHLSSIFLANRFPCWRWRPRWHAREPHGFARPDVIGQSGRHRPRPRPPTLGRALTMGGCRAQPPLAPTRVGPHAVVIPLAPGPLLPPACGALAQRVHAAADGRPPLTASEGEPLDTGRMQGPAPGRHHRLARPRGPAPHPGRAPHETPAPVRLAAWGGAPRGPRPPAERGPGACGRATRRLPPRPAVGQPGGGGVLATIGQQLRDAVRRSRLGPLRPHARRQGHRGRLPIDAHLSKCTITAETSTVLL